MKAAVVLLPALIAVGSAAAQDASAQENAVPPAATVDSQESAEVSDEDVSRFALAALLVQQINDDEGIAREQKQPAMLGALSRAGVEPETFNQIARASQSDPELQQRIQIAATKHVDAARQNR